MAKKTKKQKTETPLVTSFENSFSILSKDFVGEGNPAFPLPVLYSICIFLPVEDLLSFSIVCKWFHKASSSELVWKTKFLEFLEDYIENSEICSEKGALGENKNPRLDSMEDKISVIKNRANICWKEAYWEMEWSIKFWTMKEGQQIQNYLFNSNFKFQIIPYFISNEIFNPIFVNLISENNWLYVRESEEQGEELTLFSVTPRWIKEISWKSMCEKYGDIVDNITKQIGGEFEVYLAEISEYLECDGDLGNIEGKCFILLNNKKKKMVYYQKTWGDYG